MWIQPKTDWKSGDVFNIADYNRIKGNINELITMSQELWEVFPYEDMGDDKTYQDISFFADEINKFENNLEGICNNTYPFRIGEKQLFEANKPFISSGELNRLESACLLIYNFISGGINRKKILAFTLNGGDF